MISHPSLNEYRILLKQHKISNLDDLCNNELLVIKTFQVFANSPLCHGLWTIYERE
jgi:hypothetical protein